MNKLLITIAIAAFLAAPIILASDEKISDIPGVTEKEIEVKIIKAPDFALKNYDGREFKLSDFKDKIVVLEWFNNECPFVQYHYEKALTMQKLAAQYKEKNVVWLAINSTSHQETEKNKEYALAHKILFPILDDRSGDVGKAYKATNTPHLFIIDKAGNIVYNGAIDNAPMGAAPKDEKLINYVAKALDELLAGKPITIAKTKPYGCSVKYKK